MKLYFPTTSLNFNDIFATESISPKYFYQNRSFGTRRHFTTELILSEYYITLFEKIPYFQLLDQDKSEYEEFPIVLEFNIDPVQYKLIKVDDGIYATPRTLYLDLHNVKVIFFSKMHYNTTLVKSQIVSETKAVLKYKKNFRIFENLHLVANLDLSKYSLIAKDNNEIFDELARDRFFNSVKGFYYGYISSKISSNYKKIHFEFNKNVEALTKIRDISDIYGQLSADNAELIVDLINVVLKHAKKDTEKSKKVFDELMSGFNIFHLDNENHVEFDKTKIKVTDEMLVFQIILNNILATPKTKVGDIAKEEIDHLINNIGNDINKLFCKSSLYINDYKLISQRVINRTYNIDVSSISSNVLQNFFAFILKYNNIDELFKFIELKKIKNSNLSISFLGTFVGFSGISKIVTNTIFADDNEELFDYIDSILSNFRDQIWLNVSRCSLPNFYIDKNLNTKNIQCEVSNELLISEKNMKPSTKELENLISNNESKIIQNEINRDELRKNIYNEIHRIKGYKTLGIFIKKSDILLNEEVQVKFEKVANNIDIMFLDLRNDKIINILLKNKNGLDKNEEILFKQELSKLGINKSFLSGNYPMFIYNKTVGDEIQELDFDEEIDLLEYLKLLK